MSGVSVRASRLFTAPTYAAQGSFRQKYKARCYCGRVSFAVATDPVVVKLCDCRDCQSLHGAPMQWAAIFRKEDVFFPSTADDHVHFYHSSSDSLFVPNSPTHKDPSSRELPCKIRCGHCGSPLADEGRSMFLAFPPAFAVADADGSTGSMRTRLPPAFMPSHRIFCGAPALPRGFLDRLPAYADAGSLPLSVADTLRHISPPLISLAVPSGATAPTMDGGLSRDGTEPVVDASGGRHKGDAGRVLVIGGSEHFTGAPSYAALGALRFGADLVSVLTAADALPTIRSFSPELMVRPFYTAADLPDTDDDGSEGDPAAHRVLQEMVSRCERAVRYQHSLVIGPGLGRHPLVQAAAQKVIRAAAAVGHGVVIDADAVHAVAAAPDCVAGRHFVVLTPNHRELRALWEGVCASTATDRVPPERQEMATDIARALRGPTVLAKGATDIAVGPRVIARKVGALDDGSNGNRSDPAPELCTVVCSEAGSGRRPGGLGDLLAGSLGTAVGWARPHAGTVSMPRVVAAACTVTRRAAAMAEAKHGRAMTAPEVLAVMGDAYAEVSRLPHELRTPL
eukprot:TRINITY_DN962_c0_g1_i1.p1 TRINITY_DN962_c0_g1~~TRINITY_DN962_c0_g1_i1.p1  ORF type:complete len:567 (-),score=61.40 TRINITY_DN962_c0_g1_i1:636-2336(-)